MQEWADRDRHNRLSKTVKPRVKINYALNKMDSEDDTHVVVYFLSKNLIDGLNC
jgi:hypothetical protein